VDEFQRVSEFDYLIVHDSVEDAAKQLAAIVTAERCRIERDA
jgi:guanylate kinase